MIAAASFPKAKAKIMVVRDIERDEIEFISKTLGCLPVAHIDHMKPDKLGSADLVEDVEVRPDLTTAAESNNNTFNLFIN